MPFTFAHPALVVPLRGLGLPMTALVVGAMVPDLPGLLGFPGGRDFSHSLLGVVTLDPALGLVVLVLWFAVYRRPLVDMSPEFWRLRLPETVRPSLGAWLLAPLALAVGAFTHVTWDTFTHEDDWGVEQVSVLNDEFLGIAGYEWAQHLFSIAGLAVVAAACYGYVVRLPVQPRRPGPLVARWALFVGVAWGVLLGLAIAVLVTSWGYEAMVYYGVVTAMLVGGFGATCVCLWWQVKHRWRG